MTEELPGFAGMKTGVEVRDFAQSLCDLHHRMDVI
jgi:hypothetical protein